MDNQNIATKLAIRIANLELELASKEVQIDQLSKKLQEAQNTKAKK